MPRPLSAHTVQQPRRQCCSVLDTVAGVRLPAVCVTVLHVLP